MFNAVVNNKNFGGGCRCLVGPGKAAFAMDANRAAAERLLVTAKAPGGITMAGHTTKPSALKVDAMLFETSNDALVKFLDEYHWLESDFPYPARPADAVLQMDFLKTQRHGITSWLVVAPQRKTSFGEPLRIGGGEELSVKERHRSGGRGFQVFGEQNIACLPDTWQTCQRTPNV
ncbi:MAG: hypothetical protein IPF87_08305 [Gemmatimonadetes bacterium]|nr:hypothetical protein [Gemmatimonadota bacterium]